MTKKASPTRSTLNRFLDVIPRFKPRYQNGDEVWEFHFPVGKTWHHLWVKRYQGVFYLGGTNIELLEVTPLSMERLLPEDQVLFKTYRQALLDIHRQLKRDPLGYYLKLNWSVPPKFRLGIIPRTILKTLMPDFWDFEKMLGSKQMAKVIQLLKNYKEPEPVQRMTSGLFFKYCETAYRANPREHKWSRATGTSGREMYKKWADGRDGGLAELPTEDEAAFKRWFENREWAGGHPWEIYRGGNSTHINLAVSKHEYREGWQVWLSAFSSSRLAETCRIALALDQANLPFILEHHESYLSRLLAQDYVGIVPEGDDLTYGWHRFPKEFSVADCMYFSWFRDPENKIRYPTRKIRQMVSWFPIEPLMPA